MERVYKCPICGKTYTSLKDMYMCAQKCEMKETENENKIEKERKIAEQSILSKYEALKTEIHNYNVKYAPNCFDLIMKHQGKTLANKDEEVLNKMKNVKPPLNYNEKTSEDLEDFLQKNLNIKKEESKNSEKPKDAFTQIFGDFLNDWQINLDNEFKKWGL